ncbi:MAG: hypothetical protein ABW168_26520, partial [Sedimenticola sp.]
MKTGEVKQVTVINKEEEHGTAADLTNEFRRQMSEKYRKHHFNINNQYQHYKYLRENMKPNECFVHIDFAENYVGKLSSEIQSRHFGASQTQITLHTGYYAIGNTDKLVTFSAVSDTFQHDPASIWAFMTPVLQEIRRDHPAVDTIHFYSDGPTSQYRQKGNFYFFSTEVFALGFKGATWNFHEAGHGKGIPDGVGGTLKRAADRRVSYGADIIDAHSFIQELTKANTDIKLFYVDPSSVKQFDDILRSQNLQTVPGTMKIHQVVTMSPKHIQYRDVSCSCLENTCAGHSFLHFAFSTENVSNRTRRKVTDRENELSAGRANISPNVLSRKRKKVTDRENELVTGTTTDKDHSPEIKKPKKQPNELSAGRANVSPNVLSRKRKKVTDRENVLATGTTTDEDHSPERKKPKKQPINTRKHPKRKRKKTANKKARRGMRVLKNEESTQNSTEYTCSSAKQTNMDYGEKLYSRYIDNTLKKCKTFDELQVQCQNIIQPPIHGGLRYILEDKLCVDVNSMDLCPSDIPGPINQYPVIVKAEGDCLPACGSVFAFATEGHTDEMRVRIIVELATNVDYYLDENNLIKGLTEDVKQTDVKTSCAMYSDEYIPGVALNDTTIKDIFENEIMKIRKRKSFMGIWQVFGLASVLQMPIYSVYPVLGNPRVRKHLHRRIEPRVASTEDVAVIMWTTTRTDLTNTHWVPNHFVPVLPIGRVDGECEINHHEQLNSNGDALIHPEVEIDETSDVATCDVGDSVALSTKIEVGGVDVYLLVGEVGDVGDEMEDSQGDILVGRVVEEGEIWGD